jgi:hypothetical protein
VRTMIDHSFDLVVQSLPKVKTKRAARPRRSPTAKRRARR